MFILPEMHISNKMIDNEDLCKNRCHLETGIFDFSYFQCVCFVSTPVREH